MSWLLTFLNPWWVHEYLGLEYEIRMCLHCQSFPGPYRGIQLWDLLERQRGMEEPLHQNLNLLAALHGLMPRDSDPMVAITKLIDIQRMMADVHIDLYERTRRNP